MRAAAIAGALLLAGGGLAQASECGEQVRLLDDRYAVGMSRPGEVVHDPSAPTAGAPSAVTASGSSGAPDHGAGIDVGPRAGGLGDRRGTPAEPVDAAGRVRLGDALRAAQQADAAGDAAGCAARLEEARRLAQGQAREPHAK